LGFGIYSHMLLLAFIMPPAGLYFHELAEVANIGSGAFQVRLLREDSFPSLE